MLKLCISKLISKWSCNHKLISIRIITRILINKLNHIRLKSQYKNTHYVFVTEKHDSFRALSTRTFTRTIFTPHGISAPESDFTPGYKHVFAIVSVSLARFGRYGSLSTRHQQLAWPRAGSSLYLRNKLTIGTCYAIGTFITTR